MFIIMKWGEVKKKPPLFLNHMRKEPKPTLCRVCSKILRGHTTIKKAKKKGLCDDCYCNYVIAINIYKINNQPIK
jgi:hypothetical protein